MDDDTGVRLRGLPQVQRLLELAEAQPLLARFGHPSLVAALRCALDEARAALRHPGDASALPGPATLLARAAALLEATDGPRLRRVINATGIVLHTNLGRAPLAAEALAAVMAAAGGYCNLEFDLASGQRGSRTQGLEPLLRRLTGAEAGLAVNNCAAAVLLALSGLAEGGDVVVSRGELVEIGGGFRIPDIIRQGGARLVEIGTTNKTRLADYQDAITPATRLLLKVHRSNFRITGFTEEASLADLAGLARARQLLLVHDLGSGAVMDLQHMGHAETTVQHAIAAGADVVAFSGDKLLGGPQAGLLAGRAAAVDRLRRHPLLRALRLDKMSLAALEATLRLYCEGRGAAIPTLRALAQTEDVLRGRAERVTARLGPAVRIEASTGFAGGGTLPGSGIPSLGVSLACANPEQLAAGLRGCAVPVVGRIVDGRVLLDMLTVGDEEVAELVQSVQAVLPGDA